MQNKNYSQRDTVYFNSNTDDVRNAPKLVLTSSKENMREASEKLLPNGNGAKSIHQTDFYENPIQYILMANVLQTINAYKGTSLPEEKCKTSKNAAECPEADELMCWVTNAYFNRPPGVIEALKEKVQEVIKRIKKRPEEVNNPLVPALETLLKEDKTKEKKPVSTRSENVATNTDELYGISVENQPGQAKQFPQPKQQKLNNEGKGLSEGVITDYVSAVVYIQRHVVHQIMLIMDVHAKPMTDSGEFSNVLKQKVFTALYKNFNDLYHAISSKKAQEKLEVFMRTIIKIFEENIQITGETPATFFKGEFVKMLRDIVNYLENIKPETPGFPQTKMWNLVCFGEDPISSSSDSSVSPAKSCANVQRIADFYAKTGLGNKIFVSGVDISKLNDRTRWLPDIQKLDKTITQIYFNEGMGDPAKLSAMVKAIRNTMTAIRNASFGKNSRLAAELELLANKIENIPGPVVEEDARLPKGVVLWGMSDAEAEGYIQQHILQTVNRPLIEYQANPNISKNRFFVSSIGEKPPKTVEEPQKNLYESSCQLNAMYYGKPVKEPQQKWEISKLALPVDGTTIKASKQEETMPPKQSSKSAQSLGSISMPAWKTQLARLTSFFTTSQGTEDSKLREAIGKVGNYLRMIGLSG